MFRIKFWRPARSRCLVWIILLFSKNALTQNTTQALDSIALKTVVIQVARAGGRSPVPHTNYSAEQLSKINQAQDVPFLLTAVPSLVESSDAGTGIGYTGMRIRGSDPTRINVTINGVPLNDAESQGVFWVDLPDLAASAAEIQVQRGVGASTNGPGAFGASVNIDLSQVSATPYAVLSNTAGAFDTRKHSLALSTGLLGGKVAFTGRLSYLHSDGFVQRASSDLRAYHLSATYLDDKQSFQAHVLGGHEVTYQAWNGLPAQYFDRDTLPDYNSAGTEKPGAPYADEVDDYTQNHYFFHYKRLLSNGLTLQWNGHYTRGYGFYEQYKAAEPYSNYGLPDLQIGDSVLTETDLVRRRWLDNHFYGTSLALRWAPPVNPPLLASPPQFLVGGAYTRYEGAHFGEITWAQQGVSKDLRYYENEADKRDAHVFGKIELNFRRRISLLLDGQYRQVRYEFLGFDNDLNPVTQRARLNFWNPKAGLRWQFHDAWTASAFFGVGRREPNREDYTQSTPVSRPRPEHLFDWEAGLKVEQGVISATLNFYHMRYRDQLVLDGRLNDVGAYIRTNIPRSSRTGIELETTWRPYPRLALLATAAFSRNKAAEFTEYLDDWDNGGQIARTYRNTDLAFSPAVVARAEVIWTAVRIAQKHRLDVSLSGKYVGKQYLDNTANEQSALPAYFFSNLRLHYDCERFFGHSFRLILALNNLLDKHYAPNGWVYRYVSATYDDRATNPYTRLEGQDVYHQAGYFPQAGRHGMVSLVLKF